MDCEEQGLLLSRYSFPPADPDLLGTFYPELIGCMLDMQDVDDDYIDGAKNPISFCFHYASSS